MSDEYNNNKIYWPTIPGGHGGVLNAFWHLRKNRVAWGVVALFIFFKPVLMMAQADTFSLSQALPVQARFATADNLGQVYLITPLNAIEKYAADGSLLARYSNNRLGAATSVDVANPLKVLVWYGDFRTVVFLNRSLTVLGELNLMSAGFPEVHTVASAPDGNLWLYDEIDFQLRKIAPDGELRFESQALNLLQPGRIHISCIRDDGNEVLAADPGQGIFRFDTYGQYQSLLPWQGISSFTIEQSKLVYLAGDSVRIEHLRAYASRSIPLPREVRPEAMIRWLAPRRLLVQTPGRLEVWVR